MRLGPQASALLFCVKVFLFWGIVIGLVFHFVTNEPMPWWPDTAMIGAFMGALAVLVAIGRSRDRRANRHLLNATRLTRLWWRTRNSF
jgi:uncharacterized membrane protein AbrB (regulator of aidB expression)